MQKRLFSIFVPALAALLIIAPAGVQAQASATTKIARVGGFDTPLKAVLVTVDYLTKGAEVSLMNEGDFRAFR